MAHIRIQELADSMGISRTTVWKALHNRSGISESLKNKILRQAALEGIILPGGEPVPSASRRKSFAVAVSRMESSIFWMNIINSIAVELARHDVDLVYTCLPSSLAPGHRLPGTFGEVSGVIVLNVYDAPLLHLLNELPMPKVFLDTVPDLPYSSLNGDLMLIEGRDAIRTITGKLIGKGFTRLGFVGDPYYALTNSDRLLGFYDAHSEKEVDFDPRYSFIRRIDACRYFDEISAFLSGLSRLPDAFVCASDFVAHCVVKQLVESGACPPDELPVTGFDNSAEFENVAGKITTADVQTATIGRRLARRLLFLSEFPEASREISYVSSRILYRGILKDA